MEDYCFKNQIDPVKLYENGINFARNKVKLTAHPFEKKLRTVDKKTFPRSKLEIDFMIKYQKEETCGSIPDHVLKEYDKSVWIVLKKK